MVRAELATALTERTRQFPVRVVDGARVIGDDTAADEPAVTS
ncbi:hypothetical protein [Rhodococcus sp. BS-15]|nr:hypothetical protein [Rhodococcus sp. BS-15]